MANLWATGSEAAGVDLLHFPHQQLLPASRQLFPFTFPGPIPTGLQIAAGVFALRHSSPASSHRFPRKRLGIWCAQWTASCPLRSSHLSPCRARHPVPRNGPEPRAVGSKYRMSAMRSGWQAVAWWCLDWFFPALVAWIMGVYYPGGSRCWQWGWGSSLPSGFSPQTVQKTSNASGILTSSRIS